MRYIYVVFCLNALDDTRKKVHVSVVKATADIMQAEEFSKVSNDINDKFPEFGLI